MLATGGSPEDPQEAIRPEYSQSQVGSCMSTRPSGSEKKKRTKAAGLMAKLESQRYATQLKKQRPSQQAQYEQKQHINEQDKRIQAA